MEVSKQYHLLAEFFHDLPSRGFDMTLGPVAIPAHIRSLFEIQGLKAGEIRTLSRKFRILSIAPREGSSDQDIADFLKEAGENLGLVHPTGQPGEVHRKFFEELLGYALLDTLTSTKKQLEAKIEKINSRVFELQNNAVTSGEQSQLFM